MTYAVGGFIPLDLLFRDDAVYASATPQNWINDARGDAVAAEFHRAPILRSRLVAEVSSAPLHVKVDGYASRSSGPDRPGSSSAPLSPAAVTGSPPSTATPAPRPTARGPAEG